MDIYDNSNLVSQADVYLHGQFVVNKIHSLRAILGSSVVFESTSLCDSIKHDIEASGRLYMRNPYNEQFFILFVLAVKAMRKHCLNEFIEYRARASILYETILRIQEEHDMIEIQSEIAVDTLNTIDENYIYNSLL